MAELDVVLFGPTGVTGREVARHLARRAPEVGLTWGVAGRDPDRVEAVLTGLPGRPDAVLTADASDAASIDAMASRTSVVANLVGPYARYGEPVYRSCADHGVAELDLTGEIDWVRTMIDRYDERATETGARIVPTAGFEALPFDLAALLAAHTLHQRTGDPVTSVDIAVAISSTNPMGVLTDAVSGGTFISGVEALQRGVGEEFSDPYVLDTSASTASGRYDLRPRKHGATRQWLAPMVPSPFINPAVAHRSASLLRDSGDPIFAGDYAYREGVATETTVPRPVAAAAAVSLSVFSIGFGAVGRMPDRVREPLAGWLLKVGPKSGEGPKPDELDSWSYELHVRATDARGGCQDVVVEADGHPGYKSTATMVGEAALALADPSVQVPDSAGFLTPATALGLGVLDRLRAAGVRFTVV